MNHSLKEEALHFHRYPTAGKISVTPTKSLTNQHDLSLAYSPGVAFACEEIQNDAIQADFLTARANLVAVISNGTAVLGLGNIGALAGKPVMEGKGVLFKKFAGINVFDIEINETDIDKFVDIVASMEPTFGGINLEDIKAPECFAIEKKLQARMNIPVFHDDQHGTAIIAAAAVLNALKIQNKNCADIKVVVSGAGAAGLSCVDMFIAVGIKAEHIIVCDSKGVIYAGRDGLDERKAQYAAQTSARTLADAMVGADIFLGVSKAGLVSPEMVKSMAEKPLILALANPTPEIMPEEIKAVRDDAIIATGRSDYPNQVNNVLCFPYLFRGALDVGATTINEAMKRAAVEALATLAQLPADEEVISAYDGQRLIFGEEYIIPKPFDARLITTVPVAVAQAAMKSGVARRPIADMNAYIDQLKALFNPHYRVMKPILERAKAQPLKVVFAEGEDLRTLRAVLNCVQEKICTPILIGRRAAIVARLQEYHLPLDSDRDIQIIEPDLHYKNCWQTYQTLCANAGIDPEAIQNQPEMQATVLAALLVHLGHADTLICGTNGHYDHHRQQLDLILALKDGMKTSAALDMLLLPKESVFIADTHIHHQPNAQEITHITLLAEKMLRQLGITPRAALLSRSHFGECPDLESHRVMQEALAAIQKMQPNLEIAGEMQADVALSAEIRHHAGAEKGLNTSANLLIMPNVDAANIAYHVMKVWSNSSAVGSMLLGLQRPAQLMNQEVTARQIFTMAAIAVVAAQTDND